MTTKPETIKTEISFYEFDISIPTERERYNKLVKTLKAKGLKVFDTYQTGDYETHKAFNDKIKSLVKTGVELETKHIFNNQWNTSKKSHDLRVMDWAEAIYPNKDLKRGYYLTLSDEIKELRKNSFKCGWCGKQYYKKHPIFCYECLGSEYLKKDYLKLLRVRGVLNETKTPELTEKELNTLTPLFIKYQIEGNTKRDKARIKQKRERLLKDKDTTIKNARAEYEGFIWLMDRGINTENIIYYDHKSIFSVGWRKALSFEEEQEFKKVLKDFPFKFELKV